ncbi:MAG TPA: hypothetical protein PLY40_04200 [Bacillota bacterium]|nr:hypothetical protein [Bacillota bacterium]
MSQDLLNAFMVMGKGMAGIFTVIIILMLIVMLMARTTKKS